MPVWMANMHKKFKDGSTNVNVRLFMAKLIVNAQEVFQPYAKFWFAPLVSLIVSGQTGSPGIHYVVVDLTVTMLSWHTVAIPEVSSLRTIKCSHGIVTIPKVSSLRTIKCSHGIQWLYPR